jgi:regulator of RNase E activity RraA
MIRSMRVIVLATVLAGAVHNGHAQTISRAEMEFLTPAWKGERFADGRPRVPDAILERAKKIGFEEAWQVMYNDGYKNQFEGNWKTVHDDVRIVGRVVTARYLPSRPDLEAQLKEKGKADGRKGNMNAWPIETLVKNDVYVADAFGKIAQGTLIGDNLGTAIFNKTGTGVIFDGAARDLEGLSAIKGFNAFVRDFHPSFLEQTILIGLNTPLRIGQAVVMPGDLVIAEREGVLFIPAHLAEKVVATAEFIAVRDLFSKDMLKSGKYDAGQIDNQWSPAIKDDFLDWIKKHPDQPQITKEELEKFLEKRTW